MVASYLWHIATSGKYTGKVAGHIRHLWLVTRRQYADYATLVYVYAHSYYQGSQVAAPVQGWEGVRHGPPGEGVYPECMPTKSGNCEGCGRYIEKYVRPGKQLLCLECGISKCANHNRAMHDGSSPLLERCRQAGAETARQIATGEGELYDKWARGMAAYVGRITAMKGAETASIPTRAKRQRKATRKE